MPCRTMRSDFQDKAVLPDDDFARLDFDCLGTQIGGEAVFFSMQKNNTNDSSEMNPTQRDIRNGEHQRTVWKTALCPNVFPGKGISPVTFHISDGILKHVGCFVDGNRPIYRVPHAKNTMPALHEGNISERPHDVVLDRRERTKSDSAIYTEFRCLDVQRDTVLSKSIPPNADLTILFLKIRVGEWYLERLGVGNQLYGTVFGFFGSVNRRNNGKCLLIRLAAEIPSTEVATHKGTSQSNLEDMIPILQTTWTKRGGKP